MHVSRHALEPVVPMHHIIHEVNVPEVVGRSGIVPRLACLGVDGDHEFLPRGALHGHDDLVNVEQSDVLVLVEVPVQAVVVRDHLVLTLVVHLRAKGILACK